MNRNAESPIRRIWTVLPPCLVLAIWALSPLALRAQEQPGVHPFFSLRTSIAPGGVLFNHPKSGSDLQIETPSGQQYAAFTAGADWGRYWGAELSIDTVGTDIQAPAYGKISEYTVWTGMANVRFRYPIPEYRLQPYAVLGVGMGVSEANDRSVSNREVEFNGPLRTSFVAGVGIGLEYFLAENIALGAEVKQRFFQDSDVTFAGSKHNLNLQSTAFSIGLRMYLDDGPGVAAPTWQPTKPADTDAFRGYLALRTGGAFIPDGSSDVGVTAKSNGTWFGGFSAGANFDKYWGAELAGDFDTAANLEAPPFGKLAKYAFWTVLAQARVRYPVWNDRLSPYLLVGGGLGMAEVHDRRIPSSDFPLKSGVSATPVGAVGAGFDYFLTRNISVGLEARHIVPFRPSIKVGDQTSKIHLDPVLLSAEVRLYFP